MIAEELQEQFLGWQCRIRQYAVRKGDGCPSQGMRPILSAAEQNLGAMNIQLVKLDCKESTAEFKFMAKKTHDPVDRREGIIKILAERYFQIPAEFSTEMIAIYPLNSELAEQLVSLRRCSLLFQQANQKYRIECNIRSISAQENQYQNAYWQNYLLNHKMPGVVNVLGFKPLWEESQFTREPALQNSAIQN